MTRDDIIRMARETGLVRTGDKWVEPARWGVTELVHFAALVAAAEREACALVCENMTLEWEDQPAIAQAELATMMDCALAIRSRGPA
jgi:hypothetical protein